MAFVKEASLDLIFELAKMLLTSDKKMWVMLRDFSSFSLQLIQGYKSVFTLMLIVFGVRGGFADCLKYLNLSGISS